MRSLREILLSALCIVSGVFYQGEKLRSVHEALRQKSEIGGASRADWGILCFDAKIETVGEEISF